MRTKPFTIALSLSTLILCVSLLLPGFVVAGPPEPSGDTQLGVPVSAEPGPILIVPAYTGCGGVIAPVVNAGYEQTVVELVNAERAKVGRPPLKRVTQLDQAARYFATDMGQDDYFDHDTYDRFGGTLIEICSWIARIQSYYPSPRAENIAFGYQDPQAVMAGWMNSSGHRTNILGIASWEIGVGYSEYGGSRYWVQDFGRRGDVYPVIINGEAATTASHNVSLYIYGETKWTEMRLRNDDGPWTDWIPFQCVLDWTLGGGSGEHTVWVELRDGSETTISSDTIYLDAPNLPHLGNLPDVLQFTYSIPQQRLLPGTQQVTPQNTGNGQTLTWAITKTGTWFTATPTTGSTPASFWITPTTFDTGTENVYTGKVTVTVTDPTGVGGSPHEIDLILHVVNSDLYFGYLPLIVKN